MGHGQACRENTATLTALILTVMLWIGACINAYYITTTATAVLATRRTAWAW